MRFTEKDVLKFAEWSADRNPLHVDASYARRTHFGQPVVHGMLSVLQALEQSGNDGTAIRHLDVEFRSAILINSGCEWIREKTDETFAVTVTAEGSTALVVRGSHADIPAVDPSAFAWAANDAHDRQLLVTPRERTLEELRGGVEVTGSYPVVDVPGAPERGFRTQRGRVLALCSYIVGMELPGRSSLFTRATIEFHQADEMYAGPFRFRAASTRFDSSFRLLDIRLEVATRAGIPLATAVLRSYVPFGPIEPDVEALTHALGPDAQTLSGKVAWVIGGTRGLGADLTTALALSGCTVYAVGRTGPEAEARWVQALWNSGHSVEFLCGDAADSHVESRNTTRNYLVYNRTRSSHTN
jgi:hypothetical protein